MAERKQDGHPPILKTNACECWRGTEEIRFAGDHLCIGLLQDLDLASGTASWNTGSASSVPIPMASVSQLNGDKIYTCIKPKYSDSPHLATLIVAYFARSFTCLPPAQQNTIAEWPRSRERQQATNWAPPLLPLSRSLSHVASLGGGKVMHTLPCLNSIQDFAGGVCEASKRST